MLAWKCLPHRPPMIPISGDICHTKLNEMGPDSQCMARISSTDESSQTWWPCKRLDMPLLMQGKLLASKSRTVAVGQLIGSRLASRRFAMWFSCMQVSRPPEPGFRALDLISGQRKEPWNIPRGVVRVGMCWKCGADDAIPDIPVL